MTKVKKESRVDIFFLKKKGLRLFIIFNFGHSMQTIILIFFNKIKYQLNTKII